MPGSASTSLVDLFVFALRDSLEVFAKQILMNVSMILATITVPVLTPRVATTAIVGQRGRAKVVRQMSTNAP